MDNIILFILILVLVIYIIYKTIKKVIFKNKLKTFTDIILILTVGLFMYYLSVATPVFRYSIDKIEAVFIMISLFLLYFSYGLIKDDDKTYKNNVIIYIVLYMILLISITFFIGRASFRFDLERLTSIYEGSLVPFNTITSYFTKGSLRSIMFNVVGNLIMLVPLSFLLMVKNKKYNNVLRQLLIIIPIVILTELLQQITSVGSFDVDDIILNVFGVMLFTFIITRFGIMDKIRKLFYKTFNGKNFIKYFIYVIFLIFPLIFIVKALSKIIIYVI